VDRIKKMLEEGIRELYKQYKKKIDEKQTVASTVDQQQDEDKDDKAEVKM